MSIRLLAGELLYLRNRKRLMILNKEISEGQDRHTVVDLAAVSPLLGPVQGAHEEPLDLLPGNEETVAQ